MILAAAGAAAAAPALAGAQQGEDEAAIKAPTQPYELSLYQGLNYAGESLIVDRARPRVRTRWNIRSVGVHPGEAWQICARSRYRDPCIILDRSVHDAALIGIEGQIGSARPASEVPAEEQD